MFTIFCGIVLAVAGCYCQLTDADFKTPADIRTHFKDVETGMRLLFSKMGSVNGYHKRVNQTGHDLNELQQNYTELLRKLNKLETESANKDKKILRLEDHVKVLENNIEYVQNTFTAQLKQSEELTGKTLAEFAARIENNGYLITTMRTEVNGEKKKTNKLARKLHELKGVVKNVNRNVTTSIKALHSNTAWLMEYVRNKTEQDIGVHRAVNRMQKDINQLQEGVHNIEKTLAATERPLTTNDDSSIKTLPTVTTEDIVTPPRYLIHQRETSAKMLIRNTNKLSSFIPDTIDNDHANSEDYDNYEEHYDERFLFKNH